MTPLGNPALTTSSENFMAVMGVTWRRERERESRVTTSRAENKASGLAG